MLSRVGSDRIRTRVRAVGVVAFLAIMLGGCASTGPPPPQTGYRANVTVRMSGASVAEPTLERVVEFYYKEKRRRHARIDGEVVTLIDRPDLGISWVLNPEEKTFEEHRISSLEAVMSGAPNPFGPRAKGVFERIGTEIVEGVATEKFEVSGEALSGFAWFSVDLIPIRFSGTLGSAESSVALEVEYTEVERKSQAAFLFAVPPNYAGYDKRKQKYSAQSPTATDDTARRLREIQRGTPPPPPPPSY